MVVAGFGGNITSNAGALLLGQVDRGAGLVRRCQLLHRSPRPLVPQRSRRTAQGPDVCGAGGQVEPELRPDCEPWLTRARSIAWSTRPGAPRRSITRSIAIQPRSDALLMLSLTFVSLQLKDDLYNTFV
jgi:hypothetical protein